MDCSTDGSVPQGATWKWRDVACTSQYNIGTISSTTAANGWLVYDSDSIGAAYPSAAPVEGWVQSPSIDCSTHSSVQISFEQYFERFSDSCFVDVSNDNGTTWDIYPVKANNALSNNASLSNPTTTIINITATAAGNSNVIFRFRSKFLVALGGYNWLIDDVALSELDPIEAGIHSGGVLMPTGYGDTTSFGSIPIQFINDTLLPVVFIDNNGLNSLSNVDVTQTVYNGSTQINTQTKTVASLATATTNDAVWFDNYSTTQTGDYVTAFATNPTGDSYADNNIDTAYYTISDSIYHRYGGSLQGGYIIHSAASGSDPERSFQIGTLFEIAPNTSDTLTAVYAAFSSSTTANSNVRAIVYKFNGSTWDREKISSATTLTSSNVSTSSAVAFARIPVANYIMDEGQYAVVISGDAVNTANDVILLSAENAGSDQVNLLVGIADTSTNNPVQNSFSTGSVASSPLVRLHFGNTGTDNVNDINVAQVSNAYPNPAKSEINIPFTMTESADVNVTITNAVGATMATKDMVKVNANQKGMATFNVSNYANGIYFYTVEANGARTTKRFVITH